MPAFMIAIMEKKLILLVDDNEFYHAAAEAILKDAYDLIVCTSGMEAVEYLLDGGNRVPNLILMDIVMPDMDGWLTYNRLREIEAVKNIPFIIVSSVSGESAENHAQAVGVADFITKPYNKTDLLEKISKNIR